ncbi:hypothetical protein Scep_021218 [Stephania cephalantha]|uniref:Ubiquitin-like domain-containing protein n=1 Tax=Stephania cephalantha TaxID=152367 RepID=A0AAP0F3Y6_9MAGN
MSSSTSSAGSYNANYISKGAKAPVKIALYFKCDQGRKVYRCVSVSSSIDQIRREIAEDVGFNSDDFELYYNNMLMDDNRNLADYDVQKNKTLHVKVLSNAKRAFN